MFRNQPIDLPCLLAVCFFCLFVFLCFCFAVEMSTDGIFWENFTISFFVSLALSLLDFLRPFYNFWIFGLSGIFHKMLFHYSGLRFSSEQGFGQFWPLWPWRDVHWCHFMITTVVLENPLVYGKVFHFQGCWLIWSNIVEQWGVLTNNTLLVN